MTNYERIKSLSEEEMNVFLFRFKLNACAAFVTKGGDGLMDAVRQRNWLHEEENGGIDKLIEDR